VRLSTKANYAVRAILDLVLHEHEGPVSIQQIAHRQQISHSYLEQLFRKLRRGKLVESVRGSRGGYKMRLPVDQVTLAHVLEIVNETLEPAACLDGRKKCNYCDMCMTRVVWKRLGEHIRVFLDSITIEQLRREAVETGRILDLSDKRMPKA
jgi:Rrf2 family transcriptional regulator, iron-sulfur cluster assembly transcription factor